MNDILIVNNNFSLKLYLEFYLIFICLFIYKFTEINISLLLLITSLYF